MNAHREYTPEEYYEMNRKFYECWQDAILASIMYRQEFPDKKRFPDKRVFQRLDNRIRNKFSLVPVNDSKGKIAVQDAELEFLVITAFQEHAELHIPEMATRCNTTEYRVFTILHKHGFEAFHARKVQHFAQRERDYYSIFIFAIRFFTFISVNPLLPYQILYCDECNVTTEGMFNSKNFVQWSNRGNPRAVHETNHQYRWSLNFWCGITANILVS